MKELDKVPIPVDIHVARATLSLGVVAGKFNGKLTDIFDQIREAWFESVRGLQVKDRAMIALDLDKALWDLSKYGCSSRNGSTGACPRMSACYVREFCVGGVIKIDKGSVELDS